MIWRTIVGWVSGIPDSKQSTANDNDMTSALPIEPIEQQIQNCLPLRCLTPILEQGESGMLHDRSSDAATDIVGREFSQSRRRTSSEEQKGESRDLQRFHGAPLSLPYLASLQIDDHPASFVDAG